jgi:hypothetical protein
LEPLKSERAGIRQVTNGGLHDLAARADNEEKTSLLGVQAVAWAMVNRLERYKWMKDLSGLFANTEGRLINYTFTNRKYAYRGAIRALANIGEDFSKGAVGWDGEYLAVKGAEHRSFVESGAYISSSMLSKLRSHYNALWDGLGGKVGERMKGIQQTWFVRPEQPYPAIAEDSYHITLPGTTAPKYNVGKARFVAVAVYGGTVFWDHK